MGRFKKIKRKKPKLKRRDYDEIDEINAICALVENYREKRHGPKISVDRACRELEKMGLLERC